MLQSHVAIRSFFNYKLNAFTYNLAAPVGLSTVESRIESFKRRHAEYVARHEAELKAARLAAFDEAAVYAARVLHTEDANVLIAAIRRAGICVRNGDVVVH